MDGIPKEIWSRIPTFDNKTKPMLRIFPVEQIRKADIYTIEHEPISSIDLMERAAEQCFQWIQTRLRNKTGCFYVFCGPGNNGGDGLVIARKLHLSGHKLCVAIPDDKTRFSADFSVNLDRLADAGLKTVTLEDSLGWSHGKDDILIDALFGSGLSKPLEGLMEKVVEHINHSDAIILSIDVPSGLFIDKPLPKGALVVNADYTLTFQFPKLAFLLRENELYTGEWIILPIGLHPEFIDNTPCNLYQVTIEDIRSIRRQRTKFSHKGTYGHALLISGSMGKVGAAVLASKACLRSGVGLLTTHVPACGYPIIQVAVPEAMVSIDQGQDVCTGIPDLAPYSAIGIGPGSGTSEETSIALKLLLQETKVPLVLDADALNVLAGQKTWQAFVPPGSILTPHPGEFERLAGKWQNSFEMLDLLKEYAVRNRVYVILKGAYTVTAAPDGRLFFNSTGNPGMATGGSGDALTGMILGLMAQHYPPLEACLMGVFMHGLAGDIAARKNGQESMTAGDLINAIGRAFRSLSRNFNR